MTRSTRRTDRLVTALLGLVLLAGGVALALWALRVIGPGTDRLSVPGLGAAREAAWWPWATGLVGVVLALLALAWALAHLRRAAIRTVSLGDSGEGGRLRLRLDALATAAAASAEQRISVESAHGRTGTGPEAGLVDVTVTARHDATLEELRRDLRAVDAEVSAATGGAVPVRYRVRVASAPRAVS